MDMKHQLTVRKQISHIFPRSKLRQNYMKLTVINDTATLSLTITQRRLILFLDDSDRSIEK